MKYKICKAETERGRLVPGLGSVCSNDCAQMDSARLRKYFDDLGSEEISDMPDQLGAKDFDRWCLKYEIHWFKSLRAKDKEFLNKSHPILMMPRGISGGQIASFVKERILENLRPAYYSKTIGWGGFFGGSTRGLRPHVSKEKIIKAAQKAGLLSNEGQF